MYALRDEDGDGFAEFRREIWNGFNTPNGLVFHDGTLWIVDEDRVWRIDNVEETLDNPQPRLIYSGLPSRAETDQATNVGHWWRYMTYGTRRQALHLGRYALVVPGGRAHRKRPQ